MPNYCYNTIEFKNEEDAKKVWDACSSTDIDQFTNEEFTHFDFNKLIPMPESLNIDSGSVTDEAIAYALTSDKPELAYAKSVFKDKLPERNARRTNLYIDRIADQSEEERTKLGQMAVQYAENLDKYGALTWYEWCYENWGTKWNASECCFNDRYISFTTAWAAPVPVLEALIAKFPEIPMDIYWYEEQGIEYVGEMVSDGKGNVWLYEGGGDEVAAAVYAKCNDAEDCRYYDGMVMTREEFEDDEEYYTEDMEYPPFDEWEEIKPLDNIAEEHGEQIRSAE